MNKLRICAVDNGTGSRFYRLIPQLKHMSLLGHEVRMIAHNDQQFSQHVNWADVVIMQMIVSSETVKDIKAFGKKVIFECDDYLHSVPKSHYNYEDTKGFKKYKMWWEIFKMLRLVDGFICTSKRLKFLYGWMAPRSMVFANYSDLSHWFKEPKKNLQEGKLRLLWAGSTSHTGDLNWAKPIIKRILAKYPQVQFVYIGMGGAPTDDLYAQFIYGEDFFADIPKERREYVLPVFPEIWPYILSSLQTDIAIAPLEKNSFNKAKSQCKYLEYGINEIPAVYSKWFYTDVKDGVTGFVADTEDEWVDRLSKLIENDILRKAMGKAARNDVVNNHDITSALPQWQNFVEAIGKGE